MSNDLIDLSASYYEKNSQLQTNLATEILKACQVHPTASILDVGCGDGKITAELAKLANQGTVLGIDSSPSMVHFASNHFPKTTFPNLTFLQKKAEEIDFSQQFDLVVSFSCLHWLRDPETAFQQLSESLKTNGEMLILTYPKESFYYQYLETALEKYPEYQHLSAYQTMLSIDGYRNILSKNNLEISHLQRCNFIASYNNLNELQAFIQGWLTSYIPLPEALHQDFLQHICQAIMDDAETQDRDKIVVPYSALIIKARNN